MALLHISPSNIATLILNSPPVNTLTLPLLKQIRSSLAKLDHNTKGLVICSKFPKVVSSGLDLNYLAIKPNKDVGTQTLHLQSERLRLKEYMGLFEVNIHLDIRKYQKISCVFHFPQLQHCKDMHQLGALF